MNPWIAIAALAVIAVAIPAGMMLVSWLLRPSVPEQGKRETYESGEIAVPPHESKLRFNVQYYMIALLFLVFDVETVLIFPWTVVYRDAVAEAGLVRALLPMLVFIGILVVALVWAWRNGAVRWITDEPTARGEVEG